MLVFVLVTTSSVGRKSNGVTNTQRTRLGPVSLCRRRLLDCQSLDMMARDAVMAKNVVVQFEMHNGSKK